MKASILILCLACCATDAFAQAFALAQLERSPRHHEWVEIPAGDRTVHAFVAYPEQAQDTPAVFVIHENRGLTDWVRSFADQLAAAGYLAVAPDLLSGFDSLHARTSDFASSDAARDALYRLDPDQVVVDLQAVRAYAAGLPASSGRVAVAGFCWGGSQAFRFATHADDIAAALVFYGSAPEDEARIAAIEAPVYGFYGEDDQRINATIPETEARMARHDNVYDYEIYDGAGHAFMRSGDDPEGAEANRQARDAAWARLLNILAQLD